jgi:hypothetical protein
MTMTALDAVKTPKTKARTREKVAMEIDPIPVGRRVTNEELARGLNQVHQCFEDHKKATERHFKLTHHYIDEVKGVQKTVASDLEVMKANQIRTQIALGIIQPEDNGKAPPKPMALWSTWQFVWKGALSFGSAMSALFLISKVGVAIWPQVEAIALAIWKVAIHS